MWEVDGGINGGMRYLISLNGKLVAGICLLISVFVLLGKLMNLIRAFITINMKSRSHGHRNIRDEPDKQTTEVSVIH